MQSRCPRLVLCCFALLFARGMLVAQSSSPFSANLSEQRTIRDDRGGKSTLQKVDEQVFRSSDGKEMQHLKVFEEGKLIEDRGILRDPSTNHIYVIDYASRTIRQQAVILPPAQPKTTGSNLEMDTIHGLRCRVLPVILEGKQVGKTWISNKYDLEVKSEVNIVSGLRTIHVETELEELKPGEPAPALLRMDPTFRRIAGPKS